MLLTITDWIRGKEIAEKYRTMKQDLFENTMYFTGRVDFLRDDVGVDPCEFDLSYAADVRKDHDLAVGDMKHVLELFQRIDQVVEDEEFRRILKSKVVFSMEYGEVCFQKSKFYDDGDEFHGEVVGDDETLYFVDVHVDENRVDFSSSSSTKNSTGTFCEQDNGKSYIISENQETCIFPNVFRGKENRDYDSYNITTKKEFHFFNEDGVETTRVEKETRDNYFLNHETGEKILGDPDSMENYTESDYSFRVDNKIIRHMVKQYIYPETAESFIPLCNINSYLIGMNIRPDQKRMPFGGNFVWFPNELYCDYKQGKCDVSTLWQNRGKKYEKKGS